jgi:hypothetical protein
MASTPTVSPPSTAPGPLPPEEKFWQRYSPHHEGQLSGAASFLLHLLFIAPLLILGYLGIEFGFGKRREPPVQPVRLVKGGGSGGARNGPGGPEGGPGEAGQEQPGQQPGAPEFGELPPALPALEMPKVVASIPKQLQEDPFIKRRIQGGDPRLAVFAKVDSDVLAKLNAGVRAGDPNARGGAGVKDGGGKDGGGKDRGGKDGGIGPGQGGDAPLSEREKQMYRWRIRFERDPALRTPKEMMDQYLQQLDSLGAVIAVPADPGFRRVKVIRELLARPLRPREENLSDSKLIFFYEQNPNMAHALAAYIGLGNLPAHGYLVFYPIQVENHMKEMELQELQRRTGSRNADDIQESYFSVVRGGARGWEMRLDRITLVNEARPR